MLKTKKCPTKPLQIYSVCKCRRSGVCSVGSDSSRPRGLSSPPGSSVHGTSQARILQWVAISSSRASFWPRDGTCISHSYCSGLQLPPPGDLPDREIKPLSPSLAGRFFTSEPLGKPFKCRAGIQMSSCLLPKFSTTLLSRRHILSFRKLSC